AVRRVLRRVGDAQAQPHHVVHLRRVQPHMGVRQRQPVRDQAGAGGAQTQLFLARGGGDRRGKQRQQRLGRTQGLFRFVHQRVGEAGDGGRIGLRRAGRRLPIERGESGGNAGGE